MKMLGPCLKADGISIRDMLPCLGNFAASATGLLLAEKLFMEYILPPWVPTIRSLELTVGKQSAAFLLGASNFVLSFFGIGFLFALPAIFHMKSGKIQRNKDLDTRMLLQSMPLILFNSLLGLIIMPVALRLLLPETSFDWDTLPTTRTLARDVFVWLTVEEVFFFYVHRWLHENKKLYAAVHKLHHTWTVPVSFVAIYCHPFEHIISNLAPLLLGPVLCGSHAAAFGVFMSLGIVHTLAVHSGYWLCDDNGMHDEHHRKFNVNYGVMG